jgi:hypothetical protein
VTPAHQLASKNEKISDTHFLLPNNCFLSNIEIYRNANFFVQKTPGSDRERVGKLADDTGICLKISH